MYHPPVVAVRIVPQINIENAEIRILYIDHVSFKVIGHLIRKNIHHTAFDMLEHNLAGRIYNLDTAPVISKRHVFPASVEDYQVRISEHIRKHGTHIVFVDPIRSGINDDDLLHETPPVRQIKVFNIGHAPEGIVFDQHPPWMGGILKLLHLLFGQLFLLLNISTDRPALQHFFRGVLLNSLFAVDHQRCLRNLEVILPYRIIDKSGLSALKKPGDQINRYSDFIHNPNPKSSSVAALQQLTEFIANSEFPIAFRVHLPGAADLLQ